LLLSELLLLNSPLLPDGILQLLGFLKLFLLRESALWLRFSLLLAIRMCHYRRHLPDDLKLLIEVSILGVLVDPLEGLLGGAPLGEGHEESLLCYGLGEAHLQELLHVFLVNIGADGLAFLSLFRLVVRDDLLRVFQFFLFNLLG
jgi:hypothetical protein